MSEGVFEFPIDASLEAEWDAVVAEYDDAEELVESLRQEVFSHGRNARRLLARPLALIDSYWNESRPPLTETELAAIKRSVHRFLSVSKEALDAVQELIDELESDALAPALTLTIAQLYRFATEIEDAVKRTNDFIAAAGIA